MGLPVSDNLVEAVVAPGGTRNVMNILIVIALALIVLFTKGTLDEVGKLRADMTNVQVTEAQLSVQVSNLAAVLNALDRSRTAGQ